MSVEALTARTSRRRAASRLSRTKSFSRYVPGRSLGFHLSTRSSASAHRLRSMSRSHACAFAISCATFPSGDCLCSWLGVALNNGHYAGRVDGRNVWPVTYLMLQSVEGGAVLFLYIVATFYAAELIWRERDTHFDGIHDALPMSESTDWLSKLTALCVVELVLLTIAGSAASSCRRSPATITTNCCSTPRNCTSLPSLRFSSSRSSQCSCRPSSPTSSSATASSSAIRHQPILFNFGWENTLYLFGATPPYTYSDMNGYGHFVPPLFWSITYWLSMAAFLGVLSIGLARRGAEDSLRARLHLLRQNALRTRPGSAGLSIDWPWAAEAGTTTTPTSSTNT